MKAAVMVEGGLEVRDMPEPGEPGPDQVKVKIAYCGICGSELHSLDPDYTSRPPQFKAPPGGGPMGPRIGGHEAAGIVAAIGSNVKGLEVGDRVGMNFRSPCGTCYYCRNKMEHFCERVIPATGSYAEYAMYHANAVYKLPDDVSMERGALLEPVTVAVHTVDIADIHPGCSVLITGGGPIGMLVLEVAKIAGASTIVMSEPVESRRKLAEQLGATHTINPIKEDIVALTEKVTEGRGYDRVIEASGKIAVAKQCVELAGKGATVVWAAMYPVGVEVGVPPSEMYGKELTIKGVFISPYSFPRSVNLLNTLDLDPLISIRPIEEIDQAFRDLLAGKGMKILIKPD
ncbi:MAG: alcohol dehydrogenase catalytic domain-containing protein [Dehalococcoidales bacterium]|nr:alcohol dehydrogenase catalytic domain-containing protein [Dehalococcoidales bacterium]